LEVVAAPPFVAVFFIRFNTTKMPGKIHPDSGDMSQSKGLFATRDSY